MKMRLKTLVLCSTSAAAIAIVAAPALAQSMPADPNAAPLQTAEALNAGGNAAEGEVVVTGIRASLQSAQNIKRNAEQQIDSVVAEDIGKLPDVALSDTAARIPGVQVDRSGGEASHPLIRGLPNFTTTYNGREIFTAETRLVALQDFPSAGIAALEIFKTSTANLVEPGLAGLVNVRSRRPFDFKGLEVAGSLWGQFEKQSGGKDPNGNLLISDRWDTGIGELGALLNMSYTRLRYLDSTRSNTDFVAANPIGTGGSTIYFPDIQRIDYGSGLRSRPSINGALQWRPEPGLELYAEGLWQGFRNQLSDRELTVPLWGGSSYTNVVPQQGGNLLDTVTVANPFRPDGFQGGTFNKTNTFQYAVGGKYETGPLRITTDLAHTKSTFTGSTASVDYAFTNPFTVNASSTNPSFDLAGFNPADPANYIYRGYYEEHQVAKGNDWQFRTDAEYQTGMSLIDRIQVGVRYVDRKVHREYGNRYFGGDPVLNQHIPFSAVPLDYELFRTGFRGDGGTQPVQQWLAPTYSSIRDNMIKLRQFSISHGATNYTLENVAPDPGQTYDAGEKSYAGYGQLHYSFGSGIRVDGDVGVRLVHTRDTIVGTTVIAGVATPVNLKNSYTDWLPNASARVRFTDQLQLRLSATKTRTRPDFGQLNPGGSVDAPPSCTPNTTTCIRNLNGGNPYLTPIKANNYDASLEYYFSHSGSASFAVFRRDIKGFIQNFQQFVTDPTYGLVRANRPFNSNAGRIDGFEAQATSFLDWDALPEWTKGFGAQANVTYLKTRVTLPTALGGFTTPIVAPDGGGTGVSKWTYNLAGFYDHGGLSLRVSYNHRSKFETLFRPDLPAYVDNAPGSRLYVENTRAIGRLDFSGSYTVIQNLTLFADWTNMLNKPYRSTETTYFTGGPTVTFPRAVRYEESVYSAGIRFRF
jgi:iron complex outermembrane receptor protein